MLGVGNHDKDDVLHNDEDINAARIVLDASSSIQRPILFHKRLASFHNGLTSACGLGVLVSDDKHRTDIVMFLDEIAVPFCPEDVSLDLFLDKRGYLFLDSALTVVADVTMEVEESYECFRSCFGLIASQQYLGELHIPWLSLFSVLRKHLSSLPSGVKSSPGIG